MGRPDCRTEQVFLRPVKPLSRKHIESEDVDPESYIHTESVHIIQVLGNNLISVTMFMTEHVSCGGALFGTGISDAGGAQAVFAEWEARDGTIHKAHKNDYLIKAGSSEVFVVPEILIDDYMNGRWTGEWKLTRK